MRVLTRTSLAMAWALALALPAFAGGDDYDAANDTEGKGPVYYGFVRDNRGSPVSDARVVLQPKSGEALVLKIERARPLPQPCRQGIPPRRHRYFLRQERLQAGDRRAAQSTGLERDEYRDQLYVAAIIDADVSGCAASAAC